MAKPYCYRCESEVVLEQDGASCSNCGTTLVAAPPTAPNTPNRKQARTASQHRRQIETHTLGEDQRRREHSDAVEIANNRFPEPVEGVAA